jgi:hypothetical protein
VYPNDGTQKPGQSEHGSGTTPTLMGPDLVAITDNADPIDVIAYRRSSRVTGPRELCRADDLVGIASAVALGERSQGAADLARARPAGSRSAA